MPPPGVDFSIGLCYPGPIVVKQVLRERLLKKLRQQAQKSRLAKSRRIAVRLRRLSVYRRAKFLLCYAAFDGEVESRPLMERALAEGKRVAVPVTQRGTRRIVPVEIQEVRRGLSRRGNFGILEPRLKAGRSVPLRSLDLLIVPGVAFDRQGRRLGRGGGYFDRFLARVPRQVPRVGLAFRFQLLKKLPQEPHDQPVCRVVTD